MGLRTLRAFEAATCLRPLAGLVTTRLDPAARAKDTLQAEAFDILEALAETGDWALFKYTAPALRATMAAMLQTFIEWGLKQPATLITHLPANASEGDRLRASLREMRNRLPRLERAQN